MEDTADFQAAHDSNLVPELNEEIISSGPFQFPSLDFVPHCDNEQRSCTLPSPNYSFSSLCMTPTPSEVACFLYIESAIPHRGRKNQADDTSRCSNHSWFSCEDY